LVDVQTIGVVVTAASVSVAAIYYIMNLRETMRNRKITLTNNLMQSFLTPEGCLRFAEMLNMQWSDIKDYYMKYDSNINPSNFAMRYSYWSTIDLIGHIYKEKLVDLETLYSVTGPFVVWTWVKFNLIIKDYRKMAYGKDMFRDFEDLARVMYELKKQRDPSFLADQTYFTPEDYVKTFGK
jgi:hypothetical protein